MHPLTNFEIDRYLQHIPHYRGTYMSDRLPKKMKLNEITVVNLDIHPGTHWCLIYNSPKIGYSIYIDPFGVIPNVQTSKYMKLGDKPIKYNTLQIQHIDSVLCGYYCIYFAIELHKGRHIYDVIYDFRFDDAYNEQLIRKYFNI